MHIRPTVNLFICSIFVTISYCQDTVSQHHQVNATAEDCMGVNPYPETRVQRGTSAFLTISGVAELALGIAFSSNVDVERQFSNNSLANAARRCDNMLLLAGILQCAVGLPVFIAAGVERSKHDGWDRTHCKPSISFNGSSIAVNF